VYIFSPSLSILSLSALVSQIYEIISTCHYVKILPSMDHGERQNLLIWSRGIFVSELKMISYRFQYGDIFGWC
jgi:hypothetical protein